MKEESLKYLISLPKRESLARSTLNVVGRSKLLPSRGVEGMSLSGRS